MYIIESVVYCRAYGLAEARSHRRAGRLHDAPGAGGDAAEVLEEVRRQLEREIQLVRKQVKGLDHPRRC